MKALFRIVLTVVLFGHPAAYAGTSVPTQDKAAGKSLRNIDRKTFGQYVQAVVSDAFNGKQGAKCGDKPAYYCQGLMVTAFEQASPYWTDPNTKKLSFTYFRKDIATPLFGNAGLMLWPQYYIDNEFPKTALPVPPFQPLYRCAFPLDGDTDQRSDTGCGALITTSASAPPILNPDTRPCATLGITTAQEWLNKYKNAGMAFCGFGLNPADGSGRQGMDAMIQVAGALLKSGPYLFPWNEVVVGPWPSPDAGRIPLMAFFFIANQSTKAAATQAPKRAMYDNPLAVVQLQQAWYYDTTGIFVPIIETSEAGASAVFTYRDADQGPGIPSAVTVYPE